MQVAILGENYLTFHRIDRSHAFEIEPAQLYEDPTNPVTSLHSNGVAVVSAAGMANPGRMGAIGADPGISAR